MILRRFTKHVTDPNWFAVGLDVLVVITGIFLGMQVTEWNEVRKKEVLEDQYLVRLQSDLQDDIASFEYALNLAKSRIEMANFLLDSGKDSSLVEQRPDYFVKAVELAGYRFTPGISDATYQEC